MFADGREGVVLRAVCLGEELTTPHRKNKKPMLRNVTQVTGLVHTIWSDPSSRK